MKSIKRICLSNLHFNQHLNSSRRVARDVSEARCARGVVVPVVTTTARASAQAQALLATIQVFPADNSQLPQTTDPHSPSLLEFSAIHVRPAPQGITKNAMAGSSVISASRKRAKLSGESPTSHQKIRVTEDGAMSAHRRTEHDRKDSGAEEDMVWQHLIFYLTIYADTATGHQRRCRHSRELFSVSASLEYNRALGTLHFLSSWKKCCRAQQRQQDVVQLYRQLYHCAVKAVLAPKRP